MRRWFILRIGGTEVYLHPATILYLLYGWMTGHISYIAVAYVSIILHEAAHAIVAALLGQAPKAIEITMLGAVMRLEDETRLSSIKRALMILAGPAMTLLLCSVAIWMARSGMFPTALCRMAFLSNLSVLLINLVPVLPLDGGRLLLLVLEIVMPPQSAARVVRVISDILGILLILTNIYIAWEAGGWNLSLAFSGCSILYSAANYSTTNAVEELRSFLERKIMLERKGRLKTVWYTCRSDMPVINLVKHLPQRRQAVYICHEVGGQRICGIIHEGALIQEYLNKPSSVLGEVVKPVEKWFEFARYDTI